MRIFAPMIGFALIVSATFGLQPSAGAETAASRIVDRTFVCAPALVGGVRQIEARAHRGSRRHGSLWDSPAVAGVSTTVSGSVFTVAENELVWVTAGSASHNAMLREHLLPVQTWGTLGINRKRCRTSASRVPLAPTGLSGGAAGPFDEQYDCASTRRILVHVRAILESRAELNTYRGFLRTTVPITRGSLAVRTQSGKPLVYAQVFESGKSLLFTAPSCNPD